MSSESSQLFSGIATRRRTAVGHSSPQASIRTLGVLLFLLSTLSAFGQSDSNSHSGAGLVLHPKFGGSIFGFDLDQNGTEGVLSEVSTLNDGKTLSAVETFDQKTGKILKVVTKTITQGADDFVTQGVVGSSVGLIERDHLVKSNDVRSFHVINPLSGNKLTGLWTPPLGSHHLIAPSTGSISRTQGSPLIAAFAGDVGNAQIPWVFESDVAQNKFGPIVKISQDFCCSVPMMAFDTKTHQAILGVAGGGFLTHPIIGIVNTAKDKFSEFKGAGFGNVNGIAVDSEDGMFVTDTEDDASLEFYDLKTHSANIVVLPNSGGQQIFSGADIEFDPIHKLFLVAQSVSSSATSGSTIYVYDTKGNLKDTINGFNFSNRFAVVFVHIALNPSTRSGYVDGPDTNNFSEIQAFTY